MAARRAALALAPILRSGVRLPELSVALQQKVSLATSAVSAAPPPQVLLTPEVREIIAEGPLAGGADAGLGASGGKLSLRERWGNVSGQQAGVSSMRGMWTLESRNRRPATTGRRRYLVDTLQLVKKLQGEGLTAMQAETITNIIQDVLQESLDTVAQTFTSKAEMQKHDLSQEAQIAKFKSEMQTAQEHAVTGLQREVERLKTDVEKMRSELRYEIDKVTAGQRLDLNLERGRIREELSNQAQETADVATRLDREIHTLKTQLEAAKYEVIKYCVGTIVSVIAVALGLLRLLL